MGTQLNIKSEDAYRLASELAELTGESLTTALLSVLFGEDDADRFAGAMIDARLVRMSTASWFEAAMAVDISNRR